MGRELTCSGYYSSRSVVSHASCSSQCDYEILFAFERSFFTAGLKLKCDEQYKLGNGKLVLMTYHLSLWLFDRVPQLLLVSQQF